MQQPDAITRQMVNARHKVVLIGPMGAGKSSLGNLLADKEVFKVGWGMSSCTRDFARHYIPEHDSLVVDTMGINEHDKHPDEVVRIMQDGFAEIAQQGGITQVFIVMPWGRIDTAMVAHAENIVQYMLGREVRDHLYIVFTTMRRNLPRDEAGKAELLRGECRESELTRKLFGFVDQDLNRVLLVENPADLEERDIEKKKRSRAAVLRAILSWPGGVYKFQGMDEMREAFEKYREQRMRLEQAPELLQAAQRRLQALEEECATHKERYEKLIQEARAQGSRGKEVAMQEEHAKQRELFQQQIEAEQQRTNELRAENDAMEKRCAEMRASIRNQQSAQMLEVQRRLMDFGRDRGPGGELLGIALGCVPMLFRGCCVQ